MTKYRDDMLQEHPYPQDFVDALQEFISTYVSANFNVVLLNPTTLRVPAGTDNAQVSIGINGKWRYNRANADCAAPGGLTVGDNPIFVTAAVNSFGVNPTPPPTELDSTDYSFRLIVLPDGDTPTGTGSQALYRQVGTVGWDGAKFTSIKLWGGESATTSAWRQTFDVSSASGLRTIFTQSIPPLGESDELEFVVNARYTNDTVGDHPLRIQVIFGGVTLFDGTTNPIPNAAHARELAVLGWLANEGNTGLQRLTGRIAMSNAGTTDAGNGSLQGADPVNHTFGGHDTIDTSSAKTLTIKVALGAASANLEVIGSVRVKVNPVS